MIKEITEHQKNAWSALTWVLFMTFFTYTTLYEAFANTNKSLIATFNEEQLGFLPMFVNFGLVIMLTFDYSSVTHPISSKNFRIPFVLTFLVLAIMAHATMVSTGVFSQYMWPISCKGLAYSLHLLFLVGLWWMKLNILNASENVKPVLGTVKPK